MELILDIWSKYLVNVVDILIVAYIFYRILLIVRGTRATQIIVGLLILIFVTVAAGILQLETLSWLLNKFWLGAVVILAVVFNDEIRLGLAKLGGKFVYANNTNANNDFLSEIVETVVAMSKSKIGGLIVLEKEMGLKNYAETGTRIDGLITQELILSIFQIKSPIHDGAIIIKSERIHSAGCVLPISSDVEDKHLGTRHRAGVGLSTVTDAVVIIISEETGNISICYEGKISFIEREEILKKLKQYYVGKSE
ncbi:MAG: diadenylate cyclase CdaA [Endomicrobiaceae bacterium]|nr:diadenylate cyclase CdaA [Endomicrobiaceae bacterium]